MSDPFADLGGLSLSGDKNDNDPWGLLSGTASAAPAPAAAPEPGAGPVPSLMAKPVEEKKPVMKAAPVPVMQPQAAAAAAPPMQQPMSMGQQPPAPMTMGQQPMPPMAMGQQPPPPGAVPPGGTNAMVPVQTAPAAHRYNAFGTYGGAVPAAMQRRPPPPAAAPAPPAAPAAAAPAPAGGDPFDPRAAAPPPPAAPPVAPADPFGASASSVATADSAPPVAEAAAPADEDDFWAQMGFGLQEAAPPRADGGAGGEGKKKTRRSVRASVVMQPPVVTAELEAAADDDEGGAAGEKEKKGGGGGDVQVNEDGLPSGGEYYTARVHGRRLGLMLGKAKHLRAHLLSAVHPSIIDALGDRPVVSYTAQDSATDHAGIHVGHVLLSVNGDKVKDPKDALRVIRNAQRPMELKFYSPKMPVSLAENQHMVKYDTKDVVAPQSQYSWKPKYVVIGGIIAQPWEMKMYRSKAEYDRAVVEKMSGRMITVKVKTFDLRGARLMPSSSAVRSVRYPNVSSQWHYFVVQTMVYKYPIKISHPVQKGLVPVHEGVRRVVKNRNY